MMRDVDAPVLGKFCAVVIAFACSDDQYHLLFNRRFHWLIRWRVILHEYHGEQLLNEVTLKQGWSLSPTVAMIDARAWMLAHHGHYCRGHADES